MTVSKFSLYTKKPVLLDQSPLLQHTLTQLYLSPIRLHAEVLGFETSASIWTLKVLVAQLCPGELYSLWLHGLKHPQAPLSLGFSRQGYWSGLPFPSPGDLPNPGIKPRSPAMQEDSLLTELTGKPLWTLGRQNSIIWLITLAKAGLCVGVDSWNTIVVTLPDYTWG